MFSFHLKLDIRDFFRDQKLQKFIEYFDNSNDEYYLFSHLGMGFQSIEFFTKNRIKLDEKQRP